MQDKLHTPFFLRHVFSLLVALAFAAALVLRVIAENKFSDWIEDQLRTYLNLTVPGMVSSLAIPAVAAALIVWLTFQAGRAHRQSEVEARYLSEKSRADALAIAFEPKVKIIGPDILTSPKGSPGQALRILRVVVENESVLHLKNCSVREFDFVNRFGNNSGMHRYFRKAEESYADDITHSFSTVFDLRGKGDRQVIEIAMLDETKPHSNVVMLYATSPTAPTKNSIPREFFPHNLTIMFSADNLAIIQKSVFRIFISEDGILGMVPL